MPGIGGMPLPYIQGNIAVSLDRERSKNENKELCCKLLPDPDFFGMVSGPKPIQNISNLNLFRLQDRRLNPATHDYHVYCRTSQGLRQNWEHCEPPPPISALALSQVSQHVMSTPSAKPMFSFRHVPILYPTQVCAVAVVCKRDLSNMC